MPKILQFHLIFLVGGSYQNYFPMQNYFLAAKDLSEWEKWFLLHIFDKLKEKKVKAWH